MKLEGGLTGYRKPYPIEIYPLNGLSRTKVTIENDNQLMNVIDTIANDEFSKKKKISEILFEAGIEETMQVIDERTLIAYDEYLYHEKNPAGIYNDELWFYLVKTCNEAFRVRF